MSSGRLRYRRNGSTTLAYFDYDDYSTTPGNEFYGYCGKGRRTKMLYGPSLGNEVKYFYDGRGRVVKTGHTLDGTTYTVQSSYDDYDRLVTITQPDGEVLKYSYGDHGLPIKLESNLQGPIVQSVSYNELARPAQVTFGNGMTTNYQHWGVEYVPGGYDNSYYGMLRSIKSGPSDSLQNLEYSYDLKGNVSAISDGRANESLTFGYDELDRLLQVRGSYSQDYTYNTIGNMTCKKGDASLSECRLSAAAYT